LKKLTEVVQNRVRTVGFCSGVELSEGNHRRFNAQEGSLRYLYFGILCVRNCVVFWIVTSGWEQTRFLHLYTEDGVGRFFETLVIIYKITLLRFKYGGPHLELLPLFTYYCLIVAYKYVIDSCCLPSLASGKSPNVCYPWHWLAAMSKEMAIRNRS
jgi:hypothetical protein